MLTATDLTGEEAQDKKNPRFLLLMLALFIMAGIGYAAFWWIQQKEKIVPIVKEEQVVDESAQAWYEEQRKLMEAQMNIAPLTDSANNNDSTLQASVPQSDSVAIEASTAKAEPIDIRERTPEVAPAIAKPSITKPAAVEPAAARPTVTKPAMVEPSVVKPTVTKALEPRPAEPKPTRIRESYPSENSERVEAPRRKTERKVDDNVRNKSAVQYWDEQTIQQTYNGSIPPTNNRRPANQYNYSEPIDKNAAYQESRYDKSERTDSRSERNAVKAEPKPLAQPKNDFSSVMITRDELEEFMRQFPYKKTTIQFVTYNRPTEGTEAIKAQIIQFLKQQGYTDIEVNWNIWLDHTPVREVHYGKYGLTGACFYIPVLK